MQERYTDLEADLEKVVIDYITRIESVNSPFMSEIESHKVFEGEKSIMLRESGEEDETNIRTFSSASEIKHQTILYGPLSEIFEAFAPVGIDMMVSKEQLMLDVLQETTAKTGNVIEAKGEPFSPTMVLRLLEEMPIDFDEDGNPKLQYFVGSPRDMRDIQDLIDEFEKDEDRKALKALLERKKVEWRAREADRVLVG